MSYPLGIGVRISLELFRIQVRRSSRISYTNRCIEAIDIDLVVLLLNFVYGFRALVVAPSIVAAEITSPGYDPMRLIRYNCVAPCVIHPTSPIICIRCLRIPKLHRQNQKRKVFLYSYVHFIVYIKCDVTIFFTRF